MQEIKLELSLFYDGQFFTALFERHDEDGYSVAKQVFAAIPSDREIFQLILDGYYSLSFSKPIRNNEMCIADKIRNPKRMQREAAKSLYNTGFSTKAQEAIKLQHEEMKELKENRHTEKKKMEADMQYELRAEKKKQKHKGR